jgi:hemerythrin
MALLHWRESFSLGVPAIDNDHRKLIDALNRLHLLDALRGEPQAIAALLSEVMTHTQAHFRREEMLMRLTGYPGYEAHKEQHRLIAERVGELAGRFRPDMRDARAERFCQALADWLLVHLIEEDSKIRPYVEKLEGAYAA